MKVLTAKQAALQWIAFLDPSLRYELREELPSGQFVTHRFTEDCIPFTHSELKWYVQNIWLDSHPPELVICPIPAP